MLIDTINVYRVAMPLVYPFRTAFGNDAVIESVLVKISSNGIVGWGESSPWKAPAYSSEFAAAAFMLLRDFIAPLVMRKDIESPEQLLQILSCIKGNYFAKAAIDLAWWDLYSKLQKKPLWKVLGGTRDKVEVGADFGIMESIDKLLETIEISIKAGFKRVKLKYRPGWEIDMVSSVRNAFPKLTMHIDCNSAYTLSDIEMFKKLDKYELSMIEQPLMHDDLVDHAVLANRIATPICLDESITSIDKARKAVQLKSCRWINIKPGRVGGITNAKAIHDFCNNEGVPCWIGGMLESSIGSSACIALATLPNIRYPSDIFPTKRFYEKDLGIPEILLSGPSEIAAPNVAGIGAAADESQLKKYTIEAATLP